MIWVLQNAQFEMDNKFYATWNFYTSYTEGHVAAAGKRSHQWRVSLTPNNTKTIGRMTCHFFLRPIRRDLPSSSYTARVGYTELGLHRCAVIKANFEMWCFLNIFFSFQLSNLNIYEEKNVFLNLSSFKGKNGVVLLHLHKILLQSIISLRAVNCQEPRFPLYRVSSWISVSALNSWIQEKNYRNSKFSA